MPAAVEVRVRLCADIGRLGIELSAVVRRSRAMCGSTGLTIREIPRAARPQGVSAGMRLIVYASLIWRTAIVLGGAVLGSLRLGAIVRLRSARVAQIDGVHCGVI